jgi:hypothetical protein
MSKLLIAFVVTTLSAFAQVVPGKYVLLLEDQPVSAHYAGRTELNSAAALNYRQQVEARQAAIKRNLAARSFVVTGSTSVLANVIFVNAPANSRRISTRRPSNSTVRRRGARSAVRRTRGLV